MNVHIHAALDQEHVTIQSFSTSSQMSNCNNHCILNFILNYHLFHTSLFTSTAINAAKKKQQKNIRSIIEIMKFNTESLIISLS